jgi:hypothetical protein
MIFVGQAPPLWSSEALAILLGLLVPTAGGSEPAPAGQTSAAPEPAKSVAENPAAAAREFDLRIRASTLNAYSPALILVDAQVEGGSDSDARLACPKLQWRLTGIKDLETGGRRGYTQDDQFWDRAAVVSPGSPSPNRERRKISTVTRRPRKCGETETAPEVLRLYHHELNLSQPGTYWIQAVLQGEGGLELHSSELRIRILPGVRDP